MSLPIRVPTVRDLAAVARAARDAVVPATAMVALNGVPYRLLREFRGGGAERDHALLARAAQDCALVYDVGANVGLAALQMARAMAPGARVVAFEPSEDAARLLLRHAELNPAPAAVEVVNALVGDASGAVVPFYWQHHSAGASTVPGHLDNTARGADCLGKAAVSLDAFAGARGEVPGFVKVDVEGAELDVLRGMRGLLADGRPVVVVEVHTLPTLPLAEHAARIVELLETVGYVARYPRTGEVLDGGDGARRVLASRGRTHLYLHPAGRPAPDWLQPMGLAASL